MAETEQGTWLLLVGTYSRKESFVDGKGKGVYVFRFDPLKGTLEFSHVKEQVGINPAFLAGPHGPSRTVYLINECDEPMENDTSVRTGYLRALELASDGSLVERNCLETRGSFPCHVSLDPTESVVTVSNYGGGSLIAFPINASNGSLAPHSDFHQFEGASHVNVDRQEAPHIHSATWLKGSQHVFAADLGNDCVRHFIMSPATKKLEISPTSPCIMRPPGSGPRHMALHPSMQVIFVLDELSNTIGVHNYDAEAGQLADESQNISTLPQEFQGLSLAADIHVSRCGHYVYASNRGHDSIACFRVLKSEGRYSLESIGWEPTRGKSPRNFCIHENLLLAANQDTDTIEVFRIDTSTGALQHTGQSVHCPTPVCLLVVPPQ